MVSNPNEADVKEARASLERMQQFDASVLPRRDELGSAFSFEEAVPPAERLVDLYLQLPVELLEALPSKLLQRIKKQADHDYALLNAILEFTASGGQPDE